MQQLTSKENEKVCAMYFGCDFIVDRFGNHVFCRMGIRNTCDYPIVIYKSEFERLCIELPIDSAYAAMVSEIKLLLTPLSSITDEDAIKVAELIRNCKYTEKTKVITDGNQTSVYSSEIVLNDKSVGFRYRTTIYDDCFIRIEAGKPTSIMNYEAYQYLISKCYALPLFFAPDHWANGYTAIELGIAIDKSSLQSSHVAEAKKKKSG